MSTAKQTLKHHLEWRINFLIGDSSTFLWAKSVNGDIFFKQKGIGGGNFLITLGSFACLNLISKIYWILSKNPDDYPFIDKVAKKDFYKQKEAIKKKLGKHQFDLFFKYCSKDVREGFQINEMEAFANLVSILNKDGIDLGLGNDKRIIMKAWDDLRNQLSHLAAPGSKIAAASEDYTKGKDLANIVKKLKKDFKSPFLIKQNGEVIVHADLLNQYLTGINKWLSKKIDTAIEEKVVDCLKEMRLR